MDRSLQLRDQLLTTKFIIPSPPHTLLPRLRLADLLTSGQKQKLTLASAPAGFGKTILLGSWVQSLPAKQSQVVWVSLDENDNTLSRFWGYILTALNSRQPGLYTSHLSLLQEPLTSIQDIQTRLINTLVEQSEQFILVLDDYHLITEPAIHSSVTFLLEHLPTQLRLILSTRTHPPLALSRLRARDQVLELGIEQLRCTTEEIGTFFNHSLGIMLTDEEIQEVETHTEGWIGALQLLALSMRRHACPKTALRELHGSQSYILEYLSDEVLRQQPMDMQNFLLHTSILDSFNASLCDNIMCQRGSQLVLEQLEKTNLFIVALDERHQWSRYHPLFAEALRFRLQQTDDELAPILHLRASQWYAEQGNLHEAVYHAISARDWQRVADLIEQVCLVIWNCKEHAMLRRWLDQIPTVFVFTRPRLCLALAKILYQIASYMSMENWLHGAEVALQARLSDTSSDLPGRNVLLMSEQQEFTNIQGEIAAYRAIIVASNLGDGQTSLAFCQEALTHLSKQNLPAQAEVACAQSLAFESFGESTAAINSAREATALAQSIGNLTSMVAYMGRTAFALRSSGHLHEAMHLAQQAISLGQNAVGLTTPMLAWSYCIQADILCEWNQLDEALKLALRGVDQCKQTESFVMLSIGYTILMNIYLARYELNDASLAFQVAESTLEKTSSSYRRDAFMIVDWVQFWLASGDIDRARRWAKQLMPPTSALSPLVRERHDVACARILLAQKKPTEALLTLQKLLDGAERQERYYHVVEMKILQVLAHHMRNEEMRPALC